MEFIVLDGGQLAVAAALTPEHDLSTSWKGYYKNVKAAQAKKKPSQTWTLVIRK